MYCSSELYTYSLYRWSTDLLTCGCYNIHCTYGFKQYQVPWIQLQHYCWHTPCTHYWLHEFLLWHHFWCWLPWHMQSHTWLWQQYCQMDGIYYSSPRRLGIFSYNYYTSLLTPLELKSEQDLLGDTSVDTFATCILDAKYEQVNIHNVAFDQTHLLLYQQCNLFNILSKHKKICDGSLRVYPHKQVHIDLKPGAKPVHHCAYPVPHVHQHNFKKELDRMVKLGILVPCWASEWASPAFIIPKKDGCVWQINSLPLLNKAIIQKQYPLPIITDMLDCISGYNFFTKLEICNITHLNLMDQA